MPAPDPSAITQEHEPPLRIHLCGGPLCGHYVRVPAHAVEFYEDAPSSVHYRYCPYATARLGRPTFIHQHLSHDFYAP